MTRKGERYREYLIKERRVAEEKLCSVLNAEERTTLIRLLGIVAEFQL